MDSMKITIDKKPEPPDIPEKLVCPGCGEPFEHSDLKKSQDGITLHCPKCGFIIYDQSVSTKKQLIDNLQDNFSQPIKELNLQTRKMWQKTISYAQYGFLARMIMSVIVFLIGMIVLVLSSWRLLFGQLSLAQIYGPGISMVSGLGAMLAVLYRGPLNEIRDSVNDLGTASAAFIAYIHQVLQISHTFSYYYLNQIITFDEMQRSNELIRYAMLGTIGALSTKNIENFKKMIESIDHQSEANDRKMK